MCTFVIYIINYKAKTTALTRKGEQKRGLDCLYATFFIMPSNTTFTFKPHVTAAWFYNKGIVMGSMAKTCTRFLQFSFYHSSFNKDRRIAVGILNGNSGCLLNSSIAHRIGWLFYEIVDQYFHDKYIFTYKIEKKYFNSDKDYLKQKNINLRLFYEPLK